MRQVIKVLVQVPHPTQAGRFSELLRSTIELDSSLKYDYQGLVDGIRLLYPNKNLVINFSIL